MKIIEIITFLGAGGAERFVVDLSNELAKENEVYLVALLNDQKDAETRSFYKFAIDTKVKYINLGLPNGLKICSQLAVKKAIERINPDIIHFHMVPTIKYSALAAFMLAWKYKIYFTVHNDLHNGYDCGFAKFTFNTLGKWGRFKLICLSNKNYEDFRKFYSSKINIRCIVNGRSPIIATEKIKSVQEELNNLRSSENSLLFLHIARFNPQKNQKLLIDTFNIILEEHANIDLAIIGGGFDTDEGKKLQKIAHKNIHFLGTRKNIADYMLSSDVFCLSSDFEGMPITLLEASLAGVPAVSTPVCGAVDLIKDGINGILSTGHSVEEYKQAILKAINNFSNLKKNAMKMKENSPYTIAECASKYLDYFKE